MSSQVSPESLKRAAIEQNLAAERFMQDLQFSGKKDSFLNEEQTISRYLLKGASPSHDTLHRVKGATTGRQLVQSPESMRKLVEIPEESSTKKYKTVSELPQATVSEFQSNPFNMVPEEPLLESHDADSQALNERIRKLRNELRNGSEYQPGEVQPAQRSYSRNLTNEPIQPVQNRSNSVYLTNDPVRQPRSNSAFLTEPVQPSTQDYQPSLQSTFNFNFPNQSLHSQLQIQQDQTARILEKSRSISPPVRDTSPPFLKKQLVNSGRSRQESGYRQESGQKEDLSNSKIMIRTSSVPSQISGFKQVKLVKSSRSGSQLTKKSVTDVPDIKNQLNLDKFYQDLIKSERKEFQKVLKQKVNLERASTTQKMRKQLEAANIKFQKISEIEKKLKYTKNHNERLRVEYEAMRQQMVQTQKQLDVQTQENQVLRGKLDSLWNKYEEEKDVVMLVTKSEIEKQKNDEIQLLNEKLESMESENRELTQKLEQLNTLQQENYLQEIDKTQIKVTNEVLQSRLERLQIENKRLKEELENSQEQQMQELKNKYDFIKEKYEMMASSSSQLKQYMNQTQKMSAFTQTEMVMKQQKSQKSQTKNYEAEKVKVEKIHRQSTDEKTKELIREYQTEAELWKLRCNLLASKYFTMIKDLKENLLTVRVDAIEQLQNARKEFEEQLMQEFRNKLSFTQRLKENNTKHVLNSQVQTGAQVTHSQQFSVDQQYEKYRTQPYNHSNTFSNNLNIYSQTSSPSQYMKIQESTHEKLTVTQQPSEKLTAVQATFSDKSMGLQSQYGKMMTTFDNRGSMDQRSTFENRTSRPSASLDQHRSSVDSRDRAVEQLGYINGYPHRMVALRSKSPSIASTGSNQQPAAMHSIQTFAKNDSAGMISFQRQNSSINHDALKGHSISQSQAHDSIQKQTSRKSLRFQERPISPYKSQKSVEQDIRANLRSQRRNENSSLEKRESPYAPIRSIATARQASKSSARSSKKSKRSKYDRMSGSRESSRFTPNNLTRLVSPTRTSNINMIENYNQDLTENLSLSQTQHSMLRITEQNRKEFEKSTAHLNTFEALNEQIQKSIASLKKMGDKETKQKNPSTAKSKKSTTAKKVKK